MSTTTVRLRRAGATLTGLALAAAGLATVAPPASAEQTGQPVTGTGTLTSVVSSMLGLTGFPSAAWSESYTAPATYDPASHQVAWSGGAGTVAADGAANVDLGGAATFWAKDANAWLTLADPSVEIDGDGDGTLTAEVSYGTTTGGVWSSATTVRGPQQVTVLDLLSDPAATDASYPPSLAAVEDTFEATASSYAWSGLKSRWDAELTAFMAGDPAATPAVAPFVFNATFANTVDSKSRVRYPQPLSLSIERAQAEVSVSVGEETAAGVALQVRGTGFAQTFPGVYVSLRESAAGDPAYAGGAVQPDAPTVWVSNSAADVGTGENAASAAIEEDGSFSTTLLVDHATLATLDPAQHYSVVTRKAHGMGQLPAYADQVTETPVSIDRAAPVVVVPATPAVAGTARVGQRLTARAGAWGPAGVRLAYRWRANGAPVAGGTGSALTLTSALAGTSVTVEVTGTAAGAAAPVTRTSAAVRVAPGTLTIARPRITGRAKVGRRVTAAVIVPSGASAAYRWFRGGRAIKGATARSLKVRKALRGARLSVRVTISRPGYTTVTVASARTAKVRRA